MNIEGTYTLQATTQTVWRCLTDRDILSQTIPGIQSISSLEKDTYDMTIAMATTLFAGSHHGIASFSEQHQPYHFRLMFTSDGETNLSGAGSVHLYARNHTTVVAYKGTFTTNKSGAKLSNSLIKGAIKLFIQNYFQHLAEYLRKHAQTLFVQEEQIQNAATTDKGVGDIVIIPRTPEKIADTEDVLPNTLSARVVHLLHLGTKDAAKQIQWEQRLRKTSTVATLLALIWIGTKIPRRHK